MAFDVPRRGVLIDVFAHHFAEDFAKQSGESGAEAERAALASELARRGLASDFNLLGRANPINVLGKCNSADLTL